VAELPFVDEHAIAVNASLQDTWAAVTATSGNGSSGRVSEVAAAMLGCRESRASEPPLGEGSTLVGFRVARFAPPHLLALEGEHRFSRYALTFIVDELGGGRSRLRAQTHAEFPGAAGRAYRALVIGTRSHVVAVRRMLRAARRRAER
jgi:hypothetical protein